MTPTQRTRKWLKDQGIENQIVEKWNSFARKRQDLFGFCDIVAMWINVYDSSGYGKVLAIQVTSGDNVSKRVQKIVDEPRARLWLMCGGAIEVHGWRKVGPRGKRKTWQLRRVAIELDYGAMVEREIC